MITFPNRLRVVLHGHELFGIAPLDEGRASALEWTPAALAGGDDAGANLVVRQAPFLPGVHRIGRAELGGLPGFLADSLPDAWGRLLVDRALRARGFDPRRLRGFDRLAFQGDRGPGALCFQPAIEPGGEASQFAVSDLDELAREASTLLKGQTPTLLDELARLGGSAGGSRPKVWLAENATGTWRSGVGELKPDELGWLVKFRAPQHDPPDIAAIEYAYAAMAQASGLSVPQARLISGRKNQYFASLRYDRAGSARIHTLSVAGLLNIDPAASVAFDYADLLNLTRQITRDETAVVEAYRHAAFNVLTHNRDDHLRQFGFLRLDGRWRRTPAYDLTFSDGPGREHSILVAGEGRTPGRETLVRLAVLGGVAPRVALRVVEQVRAAVAEWPGHAATAGVGRTSMTRVSSAIKQCLAA